MRITFLGTGTSQGIPVIGSDHPVCLSNDTKDKRLRVSVLISWDNHNYVIDCGPDFRQQMLTHKVSKLSGILFTHEHNDHVAGLDDIRPFFFRQGDIPLYAHSRVRKALQQRFPYVFAKTDRYPGAPSVRITPIEKNEPLSLGGKQVIPIQADHNGLPVFGFRIDDFTYITDMKTIADDQLKKIYGTQILVINALREQEHHSHLSLSEAIRLVERIGPRKAYFTHISHLMGFHAEVEKKLPNGVHLAYDNLILDL